MAMGSPTSSSVMSPALSFALSCQSSRYSARNLFCMCVAAFSRPLHTYNAMMNVHWRGQRSLLCTFKICVWNQARNEQLWASRAVSSPPTEARCVKNAGYARHPFPSWNVAWEAGGDAPQLSSHTPFLLHNPGSVHGGFAAPMTHPCMDQPARRCKRVLSL